MPASMAIDCEMCILVLCDIEHRKVKDCTLQSAKIIIYSGFDHHPRKTIMTSRRMDPTALVHQ